MNQRLKHTAYAVMTTAALLSPFSYTATAFADSSSGTPSPTTQEQVAPAGQLQKAQALNIVRNEVFPALAQFGLGDFLTTLTQDSANYESDSVMFSFPTWNLHFTSQMTTHSGPIPSFFNATINAKTGELLSFDVQNLDWQCKDGPGADLATAKADAFLRSFEPSLYNSVQMSKESLRSIGSFGGGTGDKQYEFFYNIVDFYQTVNGLPFKSNSISVNIDKFGHVVGLRKQFSVDSSKLPPASSAIPLDQANKIYADALYMQKYYQTGQFQKQADGSFKWQSNPKLIYIPENLTPLDAVTGKFLDDFSLHSQIRPPQSLQINGNGDPWNANHMDALKKEIGDLTQTDLSKLTFHDAGNQGFTSNQNNTTISWSDPANPHAMSLTVTYDKTSGEVLSLQKMTQSNDLQPSNGVSDPNTTQPAPPITLQQGEATVKEWLSTLLPNGSQEVFLTGESDSRNMNKYPSWFDFSKAGVVHNEKTTYSYMFNLGHQGVPILDQSISIELDPYTGSLLQLGRSQLQTVMLPDNTNTVSEDQVKQDFLKNHPLKLSYNWPQYELQWAPSGQLLYEFDWPKNMPFSYDAYTGQGIPVDLK